MIDVHKLLFVLWNLSILHQPPNLQIFLANLMLTFLLLTFLCFLGSNLTSLAWVPPLVLNLTLPCLCLLLAALSFAIKAAILSSICKSAYQEWRSHPSLTAHSGSSKCWQLLNLHLHRKSLSHTQESVWLLIKVFVMLFVVSVIQFTEST